MTVGCRRPCHRCQCGDHAWAPLTQGHVVLVSVLDEHLLQRRSWCFAPRGRTGYAQANIRGKRRYLHSMILVTNEDFPEIDHINWNGLDNRRTNLRVCPRRVNAANKRPRGTKSGYRGVYRGNSKSSERWAAYFGGSSNRRYLGTFDTPEEAAIAYDRAAREALGEFAPLNFPQEAAQ